MSDEATAALIEDLRGAFLVCTGTFGVFILSIITITGSTLICGGGIVLFLVWIAIGCLRGRFQEVFTGFDYIAGSLILIGRITIYAIPLSLIVLLISSFSSYGQDIFQFFGRGYASISRMTIQVIESVKEWSCQLLQPIQ